MNALRPVAQDWRVAERGETASCWPESCRDASTQGGDPRFETSERVVDVDGV